MPKKYNYTKKTGRPTKYRKEMIELVDEYLEYSKDEWENIEKENKESGKRLRVKLPSFEGFAIYLDTLTSNLVNWGKKHKKFLVALEKIPQEQKKRLIEMGLSGDYNSTIAKLVLSANHDMTEKRAIDFEGKITTNYNEDQIKAIANRIVRSDGGTSSEETSN